MRILIAGAGIGGLTAALCLHRDGHEVILCEKAPTLSKSGAGLQLGANALHVLEYLGLIDQLKPHVVAPDNLVFRDYKTGESLHELTLGARYQSKYGLPYWHILRSDLQDVLLNHVQSLMPNYIRYKSQIIDIKETKSSIKAYFTDRDPIEADLLIGADGIKSVVRRHLMSENPVRFSGYMAWRATASTSDLPDYWVENSASNYIGPGKHAVTYRVAGGASLNFVGVVEDRAWQDQAQHSWVQRGQWQELQADFQDWHAPIQELIHAVPPDQCYRWALYDHPPLATWSSRRVTLLGDAAHACLPFMASGAALAIEDARVLQRVLKAYPVLKQALHAYQSERLPRTRQIQKSSRLFGQIYHIRQDWLRRIAFAGVRQLGPRRERVLPSYNANTIPI